MRAGFTIIEILIVLAIAGVILAIILLAVPALQRNERNRERRHAVNFTLTALEEYKNDKDGRLPGTTAEGADFITHYEHGIPKSVKIDFRLIDEPHSYIPPYDTVAIQYAHWCNRYGNGDDPTDPIAGNDTMGKYYAIWAQIEAGSSTPTIYCVDNYGK